jgi:LacI family transcriptional regulator
MHGFVKYDAPMRILALMDTNDQYNRRVFPGASDVIKARGWELAICNVTRAIQFEPEIQHADGLLLGVHHRETDPALELTQLPAVTWSASLENTNWPRVMSDDLAVGRAAADHFIPRGFKHFAYFTDIQTVWSNRRRDGFVGRLLASGLQAAVMSHPPSLTQTDDILAALKNLPTPLAVLLAHDQSAVNFMSACNALGRRIPDEVAIVGVNNDALFCEMCVPPLSTVPLQTYQIGAEAAELLVQKLERSSRPPWTVLVPPGPLIVRQSSDAMATSDPLVIGAMKYIKEHLADGIAVKEIAAHMNTTRMTLHTRFIAAFGRTPAAQLKLEQMQKVSDLLSSTDLPLSDVARETGFSSTRQLSESFRRHTNQSPAQYRAHFRRQPQA